MKFGRPSQVLAVTLPDDVLASLRTVHWDPGWAIVQLVERSLGDGTPHRRPPAALAELARLPGSLALIVVQPRVFTRIPGIATIPLADGRAFLAFEQVRGLADLEVVLLDQIEALPVKSAQRALLKEARGIVRGWRRDAISFRPMSILVAEGLGDGKRHLLPPFAPPDAGAEDGEARQL